MLNVLVSEAQTESLLILGAYRDNEVFAAHPLVLTLDNLIKQGTPVHTLTLAPLPLQEIVLLVANTLHCSTNTAKPLAERIYQKTQGNPFFTTQFLKGLKEEGCIFFDAAKGRWQCDSAQLQQLAATDDVVSFVVSRLQKLPEATQTALKLAACLGNRFTLSDLSIVCQKEPLAIAADLWASLREGFLIPEGETYQFSLNEPIAKNDASSTDFSSADSKADATGTTYRFLHDRVQQAAYVLILEAERAATHYEIGQRLLKHVSSQEGDRAFSPSRCENLFDIVNHLNLGQSLLQLDEERKNIAQLNLAAGQKALASTAYKAAIDYLATGIALLESTAQSDSWTHHYNLVFTLYHTLCRAQLNSANYEQLAPVLAEALQRVTDPVDLAKIYSIQIAQLTFVRDCPAAIEAGLKGLKELGLEVPLDSLPDAIASEFSAMNQLMANRPVQSLLDLPAAVDPTIKATIQLLIALDPPTYSSGKRELYSFVSLKAARLSATYGNLPESIKAYINYGVILGIKGDYPRGYEFADLAMQLSYNLDSKAQRCKASLIIGAWIYAWVKPMAGAARVNYQGFLAGIEAGETQFAGYNLYANIFNRIAQGESLVTVTEDLEKYGSIADKVKDQLLWGGLSAATMFVQRLGTLPEEQSSELMTKAKERTQAVINAKIWFIACPYYLLRMRLAYVYGDFEEGLWHEAAAAKGLQAIVGFINYSDYYYYGSLLALHTFTQAASTERSKLLKKVQENQKQLKAWAKTCPENFSHKYLLVEAERCRVQGRRLSAIELYDCAIASAKENGFIPEEALANELAAKFYLQWGKEKFAASYIQEAYYGYVRWGAKVKVKQLEQQYPIALAAIPHGQSPTTASSGTLSLTATASFSKRDYFPTTPSSVSPRPNIWLDMPAMMQAAQAISQEIKLEKLLETLVRIAATNAGAESGHLLLCDCHDNFEPVWTVETRVQQDDISTINRPLSEYSGVPQSLIYAVARTGETAVFENLSALEQFSADSYVVKNKPKSVLCTPISRQGQLVGVLYLENNLAMGAFTRDRIELLQLLTGQASISIENARLYQKTENHSQTLETEVSNKTKILNQKAEDLAAALVTIQKAQAQLIQTEKMSSLGQMVAGIAHEINNPIGFIQGNITHAREYIEDILGLLTLYQQEYPQPNSVLQAKQKEIDLDFLFKDITQVLDSMALGSDRIAQIVSSLRNFSRLDEADMKMADLHSGLESTLLIVQSRLQATDCDAAIQLVKTYGALPEVMCYPSQLNQVFLHIINNAIDAVRERTENNQPPKIQIATGMTEQGKIRLAIANNGSPIAADIQTKLFDPFFTTKTVGSGIGLGLFVSYSTIQNHGGELSVASGSGSGTTFEILLPPIHKPTSAVASLKR